MTASLYIHIPFCAAICDYCDFYSILVRETEYTLMDSFVDALLADVNDQLAFFNIDHVPSVYLGGGTPSALGAARMERLLTGIQALLKYMPSPGEFTIEANPESADEDFMRVCVSGGVSRISLGVQTLYEPSRRAVHRAGDRNLLEERLALAAEYFPGAFSVDLITGLPLQTVAVLREDIERILAFRPVHVSLYSLTLEPETPLGKRVTDNFRIKTPCNSKLSNGQQYSVVNSYLPCGDEADNLWITGRDMLEQAGLAQYEVSNFARIPKETMPSKTCAHNLRYWRMENWLGAGPAASGTIIDDAAGSGKRFCYPADINAYLAAQSPRIHSARIEELDKTSLIRESLLMGFRCRSGPDPLIFRRRFNCDIEDCIPQTIARWRRQGFLETKHDSHNLALSREGLLFLNRFLRDAFIEMESPKQN
jgi:oxygen-independent coproporphyrinogen III oxidase